MTLITYSNDLIYLTNSIKPKDVQFTFIDIQIFTFKKLKAETTVCVHGDEGTCHPVQQCDSLMSF